MSDHGRVDSKRPGLDQALLAVMGKHGGRRGQRALALLAAGQVAAPFVKWGVERARRRRGDFTITVEGTDDIYPELQEWVLARMPEEDRKASWVGVLRMTLIVVEPQELADLIDRKARKAREKRVVGREQAA